MKRAQVGSSHRGLVDHDGALVASEKRGNLRKLKKNDRVQQTFTPRDSVVLFHVDFFQRSHHLNIPVIQVLKRNWVCSDRTGHKTTVQIKPNPIRNRTFQRIIATKSRIKWIH